MNTTITKEVSINAPAAKVWQIVTDKKYVNDWSMVFMPPDSTPDDMTMEGEFGPDATLVFKDKDGTGMKGDVTVWQPNEEMKIAYVSEYFQNQESTDDSRENSWIGGYEDYKLSEQDGKTTLKIEQTLPESDAEYFEPAWARALARVKELSEQ